MNPDDTSKGGIPMFLPRLDATRLGLLLAAALALGVFGPARARGAAQDGSWSERVPTTEFARAYPRWLPYVHLNSQYLSIDVDARDVVHMVPYNYGDRRIQYRSTRFETRKADGFSRREEVVATTEELGSTDFTVPDIAVEENVENPSLRGRVHVVWSAAFPGADGNRADLAWRVRDAQGWGPVRYLNAPQDRRWFNFPQAVVDENGTLHVVATLSDQNVPRGQPPKETLVSFSTRGSAPLTWREIPGAEGTRSPARLALRKDVNGTLWIAAAWRRFNTLTFLNDAYYALGRVEADGTVTWSAAVRATTGHDVSAVDVALDRESRCHLVWSSNTTRAVHYGNSEQGFEPGTLLHQEPVGTTFPGAPGIAIDSRGNVHVVFDGLGYAARIRRPDGSLGSWYIQRRLLAPRSEEFGDGESKRGVQDVKISRRDAVHATGGGVYTRTMDYALGRRDPAALVEVFPGGALNVTTGNLYAEVELYRTRGVGPAQNVRLHYNSFESGAGMLAPGWRLNYEISLIDHDFPPPADGVKRESVTVFLADGRAVHFVEDPSRGYLIPDEEFGMSARLDILGDGYELRTKHGEILRFTAEGKLSRWIDAAGNFLELQWSAQDGRLEGILDMAGNGGVGRRAHVEYEEYPYPYGARIQAITDPRGTAYRFAYSGPDLAWVVLADEVAFGFRYGQVHDGAGERPGMLKEWRTPADHAADRGRKVFYFPDGRVREVWDPLLVALRVQYAPLESGGEETRVTDRRGFMTRFQGEPRRGLVTFIEDALVRAGGAGLTPVERRFDAFGNLLAERNRRGRWTTFTYDSSHPWVRDNLSEVRLPESGAQPTVRYEEYTELGRPRKVTAYAGGVERITRHEYDSAGRLTRTEFPEVTQADGSVRSGGALSYAYGGPRGALSEWSDEDGVTTRVVAWDPVTSLPARWRREGEIQGQGRTYDALGNVETHELPPGGEGSESPGTLRYVRDALHRVRQAIDAGGHATSYDYDEDGRLVRVTPPAGDPTVITYDARGFRTGVSGPDGSWTFVPDNHGNPVKIVNPRDGRTVQQFDALNRLVSSEGPDVVRQFVHDGYDENGFFASVTEGGRTRKFREDGRGRTVAVVEADGVTRTEIFYNEQDEEIARQLRYAGAIQTCTVFVRDQKGRVIVRRVQDGGFGETVTRALEWKTFYTAAGRVEREIDPENRARGYRWDGQGRLARILNASGQTVRELRYGEDDRVSEVLWPDPATGSAGLVRLEKRTWTARKELRRVEDRLGFGTTYEYGALPGQVRSVTDALGRKTVTQYDPRTQRPSKVIAGAHAPEESSETVYGWETGLLAEVRVWNPQAQGYTARWTQGYDAALRPTTLLDPEGVQEELVFNATTGDLEDVISRAQGQERRVRFGRDALGRAVAAEWSGVASGRVERRFNGGGWVDWISEGVSSRRVTWETWRGAPVGETLEVGGVAILPGTAHEVDGAGHYVGYRDTEGVTHEYPVDEENRPAGVRYGGVEVVKRRYTVGGLLAQEIRKDALGREVARTEVRYDEVGRARRAVTVAVGTGEVVGDWEWKYDAAGQIREIVLGHVGARFRYEYNGRGELVGEETEGNGAGRVPPPYENQLGGPGRGVESEPSSEARGRLRAVVAIEPRQVRYELDPGGHRVRKVVNGAETRYGYSAGGRLLWEEGPEGRVEYVYDGWGNVVERRGGGVVERYGYDHLMRQSAYVREVGGVAVEGWQYEFWPTGERRAKRDLVRGGAEVYATRWGDVAARYEEGAGGLAWRESYLQGSGLDEKVGRVGRDGSRAHWLGDQVGTVGVVLDDTGAAAETVVRDAWGNLLAGSSSERYGFAQREHDSESGLVYMRARMYDPRVGRFTQVDPVASNRPFESYVYAGNAPLTRTDPWGDRWKLTPGPAAAAMLADLEKYTGRRITVDASGDAWFAGTPFGRQYASRADMEWIWRVQNDDSETDLSVLWTHLTGGDDWHRRRFQQAWLDYSGLETPQEAFNRGGMAGWEGFKEGITFGGYQASEWARRTEGFGISRGIGQATAIFELSVATVGIGQALGASGGLGAGLARVGATAATTAAGAAGGAAGVSGRAGITGRIGGRAPEFTGGRISESGFLNAAERYLGPGYREVSPGRYVSADGLRQVRFGVHEVRGPTLHGHFEAFDQSGGRIIENTRVDIVGK